MTLQQEEVDKHCGPSWHASRSLQVLLVQINEALNPSPIYNLRFCHGHAGCFSDTEVPPTGRNFQSRSQGVKLAFQSHRLARLLAAVAEMRWLKRALCLFFQLALCSRLLWMSLGRRIVEASGSMAFCMRTQRNLGRRAARRDFISRPGSRAGTAPPPCALLADPLHLFRTLHLRMAFCSSAAWTGRSASTACRPTACLMLAPCCSGLVNKPAYPNVHVGLRSVLLGCELKLWRSCLNKSKWHGGGLGGIWQLKRSESFACSVRWGKQAVTCEALRHQNEHVRRLDLQGAHSASNQYRTIRLRTAAMLVNLLGGIAADLRLGLCFTGHLGQTLQMRLLRRLHAGSLPLRLVRLSRRAA